MNIAKMQNRGSLNTTNLSTTPDKDIQSISRKSSSSSLTNVLTENDKVTKLIEGLNCIQQGVCKDRLEIESQIKIIEHIEAEKEKLNKIFLLDIKSHNLENPQKSALSDFMCILKQVYCQKGSLIIKRIKNPATIFLGDKDALGIKIVKEKNEDGEKEERIEIGIFKNNQLIKGEKIINNKIIIEGKFKKEELYEGKQLRTEADGKIRETIKIMGGEKINLINQKVKSGRYSGEALIFKDRGIIFHGNGTWNLENGLQIIGRFKFSEMVDCQIHSDLGMVSKVCSDSKEDGVTVRVPIEQEAVLGKVIGGTWVSGKTEETNCKAAINLVTGECTIYENNTTMTCTNIESGKRRYYSGIDTKREGYYQIDNKGIISKSSGALPIRTDELVSIVANRPIMNPLHNIDRKLLAPTIGLHIIRKLIKDIRNETDSYQIVKQNRQLNPEEKDILRRIERGLITHTYDIHSEKFRTNCVEEIIEKKQIHPVILNAGTTDNVLSVVLYKDNIVLCNRWNTSKHELKLKYNKSTAIRHYKCEQTESKIYEAIIEILIQNSRKKDSNAVQQLIENFEMNVRTQMYQKFNKLEETSLRTPLEHEINLTEKLEEQITKNATGWLTPLTATQVSLALLTDEECLIPKSENAKNDIPSITERKINIMTIIEKIFNRDDILKWAIFQRVKSQRLNCSGYDAEKDTSLHFSNRFKEEDYGLRLDETFQEKVRKILKQLPISETLL